MRWSSPSARRRVLAFAAHFALGAVLAYASAWRGMNVRSSAGPTGQGMEVTIAEARRLLDRYGVALDDEIPLNISVYRSMGRTDIMIGDSLYKGGLLGVVRAEVLCVFRSGWPMRCVECASWSKVSDPPPVEIHRSFSMLVWSLQSGRLRGMSFAFPLRPLPVGLIVNAIFYACVTLLIAAGLRHLRRRARLDRRCCPGCRYPCPARGSAESITCSECGEEIPARSLARPRQVLRLWMIPFALPALALGVLWFFGVWSPARGRVDLLYDHVWGLRNVIVIAVACAWLHVLAMLAYRDRRRFAQATISVLVTATLILLAYPCLVTITMWLRA